MRKIFVLFLFALLIASCGEEKKSKEDINRINDNSHYVYKNKYFLIDSGIIGYPLDSFVSAFPRSSQYYIDGSAQYLASLDRHTNTIVVYNNKEIVLRIKIPTVGESSIGKSADGFYIKNFDSIFVSSRYVIGIYNKGGILKEKFNLLNFQKGLSHSSLINLSSIAQPAFSGSYIYLSNIPDIYATRQTDFKKKISLIKFNLKNPEDISYLIRYPYPYQIGVYGANFLSYYNIYDSSSSSLIFSFPADNYLLRYFINGDSTKIYYAGSELLDSLIPMSKPSDKFDDFNKYFLRSPSYATIFSDPYRKVYYRFALLPISEEDYRARHWWKKKSVIILDSNFSKVGESPIPDSCSFENGYVTKDGLFLNCSPNENTLRYRRFILKSK